MAIRHVLWLAENQLSMMGLEPPTANTAPMLSANRLLEAHFSRPCFDPRMRTSPAVLDEPEQASVASFSQGGVSWAGQVWDHMTHYHNGFTH